MESVRRGARAGAATTVIAEVASADVFRLNVFFLEVVAVGGRRFVGFDMVEIASGHLCC